MINYQKIAEMMLQIERIKAIPRYDVYDLDTSCGDPNCCGGPFPSIGAVPEPDGDYVRWKDLCEILGLPIEDAE